MSTVTPISGVDSASGNTSAVNAAAAASLGKSSFASIFSENGADAVPTNLEQIFEKASKETGVSEKLLKAIAYHESRYQTDVVSSAGAAGVMQLMPSTAKSMGVTDVFDPEQNIMGGAKLIAKNLADNDGNLPLALAAYGAGQGNVDKYGGIPPFEETQNYVRDIMSVMGNSSPYADGETGPDLSGIPVTYKAGSALANQTISSNTGFGSALSAYESGSVLVGDTGSTAADASQLTSSELAALLTSGLGTSGSGNIAGILAYLMAQQLSSSQHAGTAADNSDGQLTLNVDADTLSNLVEIMKLQVMTQADGTAGDMDFSDNDGLI